ncbi:MAG: o-succinylbenzoate--CoA ligase [Ignavibacteriaceae bacterium]|nr:o-succinylbenzoate--CoA ligase [Ignavibacteriaceae bacterium]
MMNISPECFLLLKQNPSAKAVISSKNIHTFAELRQKVLRISQFLVDNGIKSNDRVAILSHNNIDFVSVVLALWQLSAIPVPIITKQTETEIKEQLNSANCKAVIVQKELRDKINFNEINIIEIPLYINFDVTFSGRKELRLEDPAVIIFTSGSENKSKGVILSFGSLCNSAINSNHLLRYTHSDRWLASLPFYHIGGFSIITRSLVFGIPLIIPDSLTSKNISGGLSDNQPTLISLVAAQLKQLVEEKIEPNPELKNCLLGGGFSNNELIKSAIELGWPINKVYGSTETSSFITALLSDEFIIKPNSVGRALPSNKIIITGEDQTENKPFEIGEVVVRSNSLMLGYISELETRNFSIKEDYHTGDLGYLDEDGYLFIEGRKNDLISTGGENVNAKEVENALLQHPSISEAAVFPIEDEKWGEIVAASIVLKDSSIEVSYEDLKSFLQTNLAGFKIPKKIFIEKNLPKTELGKVEKDKLMKRYKL